VNFIIAIKFSYFCSFDPEGNFVFKGEKVFNNHLWKSLLKTRVSASQTFEIHGLLALCTHFVQILFTAKSPIISRFAAKSYRFAGLFTILFSIVKLDCCKAVQNLMKNINEMALWRWRA
jgi:hypothetical protein